MLDINGTTIEVNKENAATFTITLEGDDVPSDDTAVLFVVKRTPDYAASLMEKTLFPENGVLTIDIDPEDTSELETGRYFWNLIVLFDGGASPWTISKAAMRFSVLPKTGGVFV